MNLWCIIVDPRLILLEGARTDKLLDVMLGTVDDYKDLPRQPNCTRARTQGGRQLTAPSVPPAKQSSDLTIRIPPCTVGSGTWTSFPDASIPLIGPAGTPSSIERLTLNFPRTSGA
jgi:hypothetical protein